MSLQTDQAVDKRTARKTLNAYFGLIAGDWQARQVEALWPVVKAKLDSEHSQGRTLDVRGYLDKILLKHDLPELPLAEV